MTPPSIFGSSGHPWSKRNILSGKSFLREAPLNLKFIEKQGLYLVRFNIHHEILNFFLGLAKIEGKLTNEQIEYLHECKFIWFVLISLRIHLSLDYSINNYPERAELKEIAKQWHKDDYRLLLNLQVSIVFMFCHYSYFLSICRNGFFVVEWLIEKWKNDDKH